MCEDSWNSCANMLYAERVTTSANRPVTTEYVSANPVNTLLFGQDAVNVVADNLQIIFLMC